MKFADYFKEAIAYGESLGLKSGPYKFDGNWVEINKIDEDGELTPVIYSSTGYVGLVANGGYIKIEQQLKLVSMFVTAYSKYLADKKRAGSRRLKQIEKYLTRQF